MSYIILHITLLDLINIVLNVYKDIEAQINVESRE